MFNAACEGVNPDHAYVDAELYYPFEKVMEQLVANKTKHAQLGDIILNPSSPANAGLCSGERFVD